MATGTGIGRAAIERIAREIVVIRGQRVMLDSDLANLYGVTTKRFNEQVKRNIARFPADFMFRLGLKDLVHLRSQNATSNSRHGGRRHSPHVFTEHGAIMAAMILNSPRAVEMSAYVVRAFVQLREVLASNKELSQRLDDLEARLARKLGDQDRTIAQIIRTIRQLMQPPADIRRRSIGFVELEEKKRQ